MPDVLIVVDMQEGFRFSNVEQIIPKIKLLLSKPKMYVVFTKFVDQKGSMFDKTLGYTKFQKKKNQSVLGELLTYSQNKIITHHGLGIVTQELHEEIKRNRAKTVYLCGVYTDVSISKAAMDFFDKGIKVKIVADAVTSQNSIHNIYFLKSLGRVIGRKNIVKVNDIVS